MNTIDIELTETTATLPKELFLEILKENERLKGELEREKIRASFEACDLGRQILVEERDALRVENERLKGENAEMCSNMNALKDHLVKWRSRACKAEATDPTVMKADYERMKRENDVLNYSYREVCQTRNTLGKDLQKMVYLVADVRKQRDELRQWKSEAAKSLDALQLQEIGAELGLILGTDIAPEILPGIRKWKKMHRDAWQEIYRLRDIIGNIRNLTE